MGLAKQRADFVLRGREVPLRGRAGQNLWNARPAREAGRRGRVWNKDHVVRIAAARNVLLYYEERLCMSRSCYHVLGANTHFDR
jgi:hypothetical protein